MVATFISLIIVTLSVTLLSVFINKKLVPEWDSREKYGYHSNQWKTLLFISSAVAVIFTAILGFFVGVSSFILISLGLLSFFLSATALTDARSHFIPKELSNMALVTGAVVCLTGFLTAQYYSSEYLMSQSSQLVFQLTHFGLYMVAISLLFVIIMFAPVIGFGDIKMFWATGLFIGSFFVISQLLAVFMLMVVLMAFQLIFSMVKAKSWKVTDGMPALPAFAVAFIAIVIAANVLGVTS